MVNIFPNIILKSVNYENINIQKYYGFSNNHVDKLKAYVSGYYEKLKIFDDVPMLKKILTTIQETSKNLVLIANNTPSFTSIKLNDGKTIKPVFDERTSRHLFEYYLLRVLINYIDLAEKEDMAVIESESIKENSTTSINQKEGNQKQLKQLTAKLLIVFIDILNNQKDKINISYEEIQDRVFKLREREKNAITDRLEKMTHGERELDTELKKNKIGIYNIGLQKGLIKYKGEYYDAGQPLRDIMAQTEGILLEEFEDQNRNDEDIDKDAKTIWII